MFTWTIRSEEHTSELQSLRHLVCRPPTSTLFPYTTLFRSKRILWDWFGLSQDRHSACGLAPTPASANSLRFWAPPLLAQPDAHILSRVGPIDRGDNAGDVHMDHQIGRAHV